MGLYVNIPKPTAWPPPLIGSQRANDLLEYGAKRDPVGDIVQAYLAALFMFTLPIDTAPASIAYIAVVVHGVLRTSSTWRTFIPLVNSKIYQLFFLWVAWLLISLFWSDDPQQGLDHAKALWATSLLFVFLPLVKHWKLFVSAFLCGVFLQNCAQITQIIQGLITDIPVSRPGGFNKHYGNSSLFMGTGVLIYIALIVFSNKHRWYLYVGLILALFGVLVAQGRGVYVGLVATFICLGIYKIVSQKISAKGIMVTLVIALSAIATASFTVGPSMMHRINDIPKSIERFTNGDIETGNEKRLVWWSAGLNRSVSSPTKFLFGHGLGSTKSIAHQEVKLNTTHPHNVFVQTLFEGGLVGLVLLLALLSIPLCLFKCGPNSTTVALSSVTILWICAGMFEGLQNSGPTLALLSVIFLFTFNERLRVKS